MKDAKKKNEEKVKPYMIVPKEGVSLTMTATLS